jgi:hypothetical protein
VNISAITGRHHFACVQGNTACTETILRVAGNCACTGTPFLCVSLGIVRTHGRKVLRAFLEILRVQGRTILRVSLQIVCP